MRRRYEEAIVTPIFNQACHRYEEAIVTPIFNQACRKYEEAIVTPIFNQASNFSGRRIVGLVQPIWMIKRFANQLIGKIGWLDWLT